MKKVLLISPPFERFMGLSRFYYPIGLASLAAVLGEAGYPVLVYDADYDTSGQMLSPQELMEQHHCYDDALNDYEHPVWKEIEQVVREFQPDVIGVTVLSITYPSAVHMISLLRKICPNVMIFTGGVHATLCPEELLPVSDYVITNEGESVVIDVINGKYNKGIVHGDRIHDLDSLPFPAVEKLYHIDKYTKRDLSIIISSRGCQHACKFCNSFDLWKCKISRKSPKYFYREIEHLMNDYGIQDFFITDDSFTCDKEWLFAFLDEIKPLKITWRCFSRVSDVDEETIDRMIDAGCRNIKFGIESGSDRILKMINKGITLQDIHNVNRLLVQKNIRWSAYFIIGFPSETVEDIRQTQKLIKQLNADSISVNVYTPLPKNRLKDQKVDYRKYSFHSPNNNFTECIDDETFSKLVDETLNIAKREYNEHIHLKEDVTNGRRES